MPWATAMAGRKVYGMVRDMVARKSPNITMRKRGKVGEEAREEPTNQESNHLQPLQATGSACSLFTSSCSSEDSAWLGAGNMAAPKAIEPRQRVASP